MALITPGSVLVKAQEASLSRDERLDTLTLKTVTRGVPSLPVVDSVTGARATLTIEGASTLEIDIFDPEWLIEQSGFLDIDANGRMNAVSVWVDDLEFRLVKAQRSSPDTLTLTFEDIAFALMREHSKHLAASRGKATRAQFIEKLVKEVRFRRLAFFAPERTTKQPVASVDYPTVKPTGGSTGFDSGTKFKIKGQTADAGQMREAATALGVADQEDASPRVRMALLVAGIGESEFRAQMNQGGSGYGGVFQGDVAAKTLVWAGKMKDTAGMARSFLRGGKGFQGGGAIALARANPGMSAGEIATRVEASGKPGSFYDAYHDEAKAILSAYSGGSTGGASDSAVRIKSYQFTRGLPGKKEDSVEAATRLAQEVQWRFFAVGGVVVFRYDDDIIGDRATLVIDGINDVGMLEPPTYDWDHGKITSEVGLHVAANRWAVVPGEVVVLMHMGPISGRWICGTVNIDLLDATSCDVTLLKALPKRKEPAPEALTRSGTTGGESSAVAGSGAADALKWARGKLGHYKEEFGANRGQELDALEQGFGLSGAPWCAMFATTAVTHGGVPADARSASVAEIRGWAAAGSHGYAKGFRATPAPGDLACFGTAHVVLVEKVHGDKFQAIQGNGSAGQVDTRTVLNSEVDFVRPNYPT